MMRIQYQKMVEELYRLVNDELEMETDEGRQAFLVMSQALFEMYARGKK